MESVLSDTNTVMVDVKGSNNMLYLPLDKMMQHLPSIQQANVPQNSVEQTPQTAVESTQVPVVRTTTRGRDQRGR